MRCLEISKNARLILESSLHQSLTPVCPSQLIRRAETIVFEENDTKRRAMLRCEGSFARDEILARMSRALQSLVRLEELMDWSPPRKAGIQSLVAHHSQWFEAVYSTHESARSDAAAYGALLRVMKGIRDAPNSELLHKLALLGSESRAAPHRDSVAADVQKELRNICKQRMMWRLLIANHLAVDDGCATGVFTPDVDLERIVDACCGQVTVQCHSVFGSAPNCVRTSRWLAPSTSPTATFCHVEATIAYILNELLKNAARATMAMERQRSYGDGGASAGYSRHSITTPPPILIEIGRVGPTGAAYSDKRSELTLCESVRVRVTDCGGGVTKGFKKHDDVWDFGFTTASPEERAGAYPIAGYGLGLPLSRLFAEQFGGSLTLSPHIDGSVLGPKPRVVGTVAEFWHPLEGREIV